MDPGSMRSPFLVMAVSSGSACFIPGPATGLRSSSRAPQPSRHGRCFARRAEDLPVGDREIGAYLESQGFKLANSSKQPKTSAQREPSAPTTANAAIAAIATPGTITAVSAPAPVGPPDFDDESFSVSPELCLDFERRGHVALRKLCSAREIDGCSSVFRTLHHDHLLDAYRHACSVALSTPLTELPSSIADAQDALVQASSTGNVPFLQHFNLRLESEHAARIVLGRRFARVAADLLGARRVRVYQDSLFWKRAGDGPTAWHSDLNMAPLDTNRFVTIWVPLQRIPASGSALVYASGSHRDFSLAYWHGRQGIREQDLSRRYSEERHGALAVGDASAHHGWCLHSADGVDEGADARVAFTISYYGDDGEGTRADTKALSKRFAADIDPEDWPSGYSEWLPQVKRGKAVRHPRMPVVYERPPVPHS